jgi:hypothetical protein
MYRRGEEGAARLYDILFGGDFFRHWSHVRPQLDWLREGAGSFRRPQLDPELRITQPQGAQR